MMRFILIGALIFLTSCSSVKDVSKTERRIGNKIDTTVCTKRNTFLRRWEKSAVDYFEQQEYSIHRSWKPDQTLVEYLKIAPSADNKNVTSEISLIPKGTKLQIKKVYRYEVPCCGGFFVMATVDGSAKNGKLVDIASLFHPGSALSPNENHIVLCEDG